MQKFDEIKMQDYCDQLTTIANSMDNILSNFMDTGKNVVSKGFWEGDSANYYFDKITDLTNNFETFNEDTQKTIIYLLNVISNFKQTESNISKNFTSTFSNWK